MKLMAHHKTAVNPLLMHWSYRSPVINLRKYRSFMLISFQLWGDTNGVLLKDKEIGCQDRDPINACCDPWSPFALCDTANSAATRRPKSAPVFAVPGPTYGDAFGKADHSSRQAEAQPRREPDSNTLHCPTPASRHGCPSAQQCAAQSHFASCFRTPGLGRHARFSRPLMVLQQVRDPGYGHRPPIPGACARGLVPFAGLKTQPGRGVARRLLLACQHTQDVVITLNHSPPFLSFNVVNPSTFFIPALAYCHLRVTPLQTL